MPTEVNRHQVQEMLAAGAQLAQLIEVLPPEDYREWHLPGAINIPLKEFNQEAIDRLDRQRPIILYCASNQ